MTACYNSTIILVEGRGGMLKSMIKFLEKIFGCFHSWNKWELKNLIYHHGAEEGKRFINMRNCEKCGLYKIKNL